eukprot:9640-Heterococcus_DN1.PRE.2
MFCADLYATSYTSDCIGFSLLVPLHAVTVHVHTYTSKKIKTVRVRCSHMSHQLLQLLSALVKQSAALCSMKSYSTSTLNVAVAAQAYAVTKA